MLTTCQTAVLHSWTSALPISIVINRRWSRFNPLENNTSFLQEKDVCLKDICWLFVNMLFGFPIHFNHLQTLHPSIKNDLRLSLYLLNWSELPSTLCRFRHFKLHKCMGWTCACPSDYLHVTNSNVFVLQPCSFTIIFYCYLNANFPA